MTGKLKKVSTEILESGLKLVRPEPHQPHRFRRPCDCRPF